MALLRPNEIPANPSDARLAVDAARGSADALAGLYSRYAKDLLATAYRLLQRREDAEDVVHDVFVGSRKRFGTMKSAARSRRSGSASPERCG